MFGDKNLIDASSSDMIDEEDRNIVDDTKESYSTRSVSDIRDYDSAAYRKNSTAGHICEDTHEHEAVEKNVNEADLRREQMQRKADEKASKGVDFSTAEKKPQSGGCLGWSIALLIMFIGMQTSALVFFIGAFIFTCMAGGMSKKDPSLKGKNGIFKLGVFLVIVSAVIAVVTGEFEAAVDFFSNMGKIISHEVFGNPIG